MIVLVCGASGFIGRNLCEAFVRSGDDVRRGVRTVRPGSSDIIVDFERDADVDRWLPRLQGIEVVVNAVGTMRAAALEAVHLRVPSALFDACVKAGVRRVVQLSALGETESDRFLATKHAADAHLMTLPIEWTVLRPSLVVGRDGVSSRWFRSLAGLPLVPLPGRGRQCVQPVALEDVCDAVVRAAHGAAPRSVIAVVGPSAMTYRAMLDGYRRRMQLGPLRALTVPSPLLAAALQLGRLLPGPLMSPASLRMLEAGNCSDAAPLARLLGRTPRSFLAALDGVDAGSLRAEALWSWGEPLLRVALAVVWLGTAWVSLFAYPIAESLRMLWRVGAPGWSAPLLLVGAALLDACFGMLTLLRPSRGLWLAQLVLIVFYSVVIALRLPEMLVHPFGPLLKNLPIAAILVLLLASTPARRRARNDAARPRPSSR